MSSGWFSLPCCWEMNHWNMEDSQWEPDYIWCSPPWGNCHSWHIMLPCQTSCDWLTPPSPLPFLMRWMTQLKMKVTSSASGFLVNHCDLQFDPSWQLGCPARLRYVADTLAVWSPNVRFARKGSTFSTKLCRKLAIILLWTTNLLQKRCCSASSVAELTFSKNDVSVKIGNVRHDYALSDFPCNCMESVFNSTRIQFVWIQI